jgi:hypothetical protein
MTSTTSGEPGRALEKCVNHGVVLSAGVVFVVAQLRDWDQLMASERASRQACKETK